MPKRRGAWAVVEVTDGEPVGVTVFRTQKAANRHADVIERETEGGATALVFECALVDE